MVLDVFVPLRSDLVVGFKGDSRSGLVTIVSKGWVLKETNLVPESPSG